MTRYKARDPYLALLFSMLLLLAYAAVAAQSFSQVLSFQGRFADAGTGKPLADGQYQVTFTIYDAESDGNSLWQETQTVDQVGGVFNVYLGSVTAFPSDLFTNGDRWLGLRIEGDDEIVQRIRLTPSPWAIWAASAATDNDWAFSGDDIYRLTGNVGVGTANPNERLTVEGVLGLGETSAPSPTPGYGKLYVKPNHHGLYFKDGGGTEYDLTSLERAVRVVEPGNGSDIQAKIDDLPDSGGVVFIPPGDYWIEYSSRIYIPKDNVVLAGSGKATHIKGVGGPGAIVVGMYICGDNVTIRDLWLDGNVNSIEGGILFADNSNCKIINCIVGSVRTDGIVFRNTTDGLAQGNYVYDCWNPDNVDDFTSGLEVEDGAERIILANNTVYNSNAGAFPHTHPDEPTCRHIKIVDNVFIAGPDGNTNVVLANQGGTGTSEDFEVVGNTLIGGGIHVGGCDPIHILIRNNYIQGPNEGAAVWVGNPVASVAIEGNEIRGAEGSGYGAGIYTIAPDTLIAGNRLSGQKHVCIQLTASAACTIIEGNEIRNGSSYGVHCDAPDSVIADNIISGQGETAIMLKANAQNSVVTGNIIKNNAADAWGCGIDLSADHTVVSGNRIHDDQEIKTQDIGIRVSDGSDYSLIVNNNVEGNKDHNIYTEPGAGDSVLKDNIGYVTETSGNAAIGSDNTYVDVNHGLAVTPTLADISVTPTNDLGNATEFWISDPTSTQFTINIDVAPGGGNTATFSWQASSCH